MDNQTTINDYIFFDVETPNGHNDSICSIGVSYGDGREPFYTEVNPKDFFAQSSTSVHGITQNDVKDSPEWPEVWEKLRLDFESKIIVAYNANFDLSALSKFLVRHGLQEHSFQYVDALELVKERRPSEKSYKLDDVCQLLSVELCTHHNALCDAIACHDIFTILDGPSFPISVYNIDFEPSELRPLEVHEVNDQKANLIIQELLGIVIAIQAEKTNVKFQDCLCEWFENNSKITNKGFVEITKRVSSVINSNYSLEDLRKLEAKLSKPSRGKAQKKVQVYTLYSLIKFIQLFEFANDKESFVSALDSFLEKLCKDERPNNYSSLIEAIQNGNDINLTQNEINKTIDAYKSKGQCEESVVCIPGKTFVLSGIFDCGKDEVKQRIEQEGGTVKESISKKTDYLILGQPDPRWKMGEMGGTKWKAAKQYNIHIIQDEQRDQFLNTLGFGDEENDVPF